MGDPATDSSPPVTLADLVAAGRSIKALAHDLNNQLGVVLAYAEILRLDAEDGSDAAAMLDDVILAVKRGDSLLDVAAALTARESGVVERIDLSQEIASAVPLLKHRFSDAGWHFAFEPAPEPVLLDCYRVRIVRGVFHVADWIVEERAAEPDERRRAGLSLRAGDGTCELRWEVPEAHAEIRETDGLREAQHHFAAHRGEVVIDRAMVRCIVPRDTGLVAGDV